MLITLGQGRAGLADDDCSACCTIPIKAAILAHTFAQWWYHGRASYSIIIVSIAP